jgi:hypothetical protein
MQEKTTSVKRCARTAKTEKEEKDLDWYDTEFMRVVYSVKQELLTSN